LLELYLQDDENDTEQMWREKREKAKQLLSKNKDDKQVYFDKNHALLVCQMYGFNEGTIMLYKQLNLPTQVAQNYMEQNDYDNLIKCCKDYEKNTSQIVGICIDVFLLINQPKRSHVI